MQRAFVANTEKDCTLLDTSTSVSWEWAGTWDNAIKNFFPQYASNGIVTGLFPVNVPFPIPVLEFGPFEQYKILSPPTSADSNSNSNSYSNATAANPKRTVLFKPREWRGTGCSPKANCPKSADLAAELSGMKKGSVVGIYTTTDGGISLNDIYDMVAALDEHVEVVHHQDLVAAALARG